MRSRAKGLFVGLATLDVVQLVDRVPGANEKLTARRQMVAAGGPATNAAVAFGFLGGAPRLLTAVGAHPLGMVVSAELEQLGVAVSDLAVGSGEPPAVSSILVTAATGERAVASTNAVARHLTPPDGLRELVASCDIVELDGHHMELAIATARAARAVGCTTLFDGGSWKDGTEELLASIDVAVCSEDFRPPGAGDTLEFLRGHGVRRAAVSQGERSVLWAGPDGRGTVEVPAVRVADTLGAGDVLHGALAHHLARGREFVDALREAAEVASRACASFGTRAWMHGS